LPTLMEREMVAFELGVVVLDSPTTPSARDVLPHGEFGFGCCASALAEGAAMRGGESYEQEPRSAHSCARRVCEARKRVGRRHPSDQ
jgi:hypothetical protein